jgi:predicted nucleotidyltransferase
MAQKSGFINTQLNIELKQPLENRGINADKIVVFGSYGRGDKREDSDIDLIIVSKNFRNKSIFERVELTSKFLFFDCPHFFSPDPCIRSCIFYRF